MLLPRNYSSGMKVSQGYWRNGLDFEDCADESAVLLLASEIESGKKNVCLPMLEVLSKGFGISVAELMKGV